MLTQLRRLLSYEFTIAELIGLAIMAAVPYLVIGVIWVSTHTESLAGRHGPELAASFVATVLAWPTLLFPTFMPALLAPSVCLA